MNATGRARRAANVRHEEVTEFLVQARLRARRASEVIFDFCERVRSLSERSAALTAGVSPEQELDRTLLAEIATRDAELARADHELRQQHQELVYTRLLLERERAKYVDLFDSAPDACLVTSPGGVVREANAAAEALLGVPRERLNGKLLIAFVARQDTDAFRERLGGSDGFDQPATQTFQARMRQRGGGVFLAVLTVSPVLGISGRPFALRWTISRHRSTNGDAKSLRPSSGAERPTTSEG
jgi:PAS domain S-box-containing protein